MAKGGGKRRTYVRDGNGRFASTPGGGKPALKGGTLAKRSSLKGSRAKLAAKDKADPSIRNTLSTRSQKGAVTRGNKALRAAKVASQRTAVGRSKAGTISKAKRSPVMKATVIKPEARVPASQRPGSMTSTLRATMGALAKADARRIREVESITGQKVKPTAAGAKAGKEAGARVRATAKKGKVADTLRAGLRELAQSDARTMRGMAEIVRDATPKVSGGKAGKAIRGGRAALPARKEAKPAVAKTSSRVAYRTRDQAASAQRKRKSQILAATDKDFWNESRLERATSQERLNIRKTSTKQPNFLGGTDRVVKAVVQRVAKFKGPATGSKAARRAAGIARRASESISARAKRVENRARGSSDNKVKGIMERRQ